MIIAFQPAGNSIYGKSSVSWTKVKNEEGKIPILYYFIFFFLEIVVACLTKRFKSRK